ncbi:MAG: hypothetical protein QG605_569, partial [Euryarchaeota archaeon]|nr:hypothetical protein [Euryarchaeota archaeon]
SGTIRPQKSEELSRINLKALDINYPFSGVLHN